MKKYLLFLMLVMTLPVFAQVINEAAPPQKVVEEQADYPGGTRAFQTKAANLVEVKLPTGIYSSVVRFMVDQDGDITNITATGPSEKFNEAVIKAVKKVGGKWKPATLNGATVNSFFKFPFKLEVS
ncbi:energy transducer TonB [Soonwooa sp.]|uniref:energy transducer TonB n=1 Tax=Soonwooa sp. TaxID=1938592 RepID=UPI00260878D4|nr:energy transducer TonB [Soonwooa sp.]